MGKSAIETYAKKRDNAFGLDAEDFFFEREDDWEIEGKADPCSDAKWNDCHRDADCVTQREGYACKCREGFVDDASHPFDFGKSCQLATGVGDGSKKNKKQT